MTAASTACILSLAGLVLLVACGNEPTPPAPVASVEVSPDTAGVVLGRTLQLTARVRDAAGHELADRPVTWTSSAPTQASVSPTGLVSGLALGDSLVIIATSEGISGKATLAVVVDLAGEWNFTEQIVATVPNPIGLPEPVTVTCSDTGSYRFTQSGATIGGTKANVGTCVGRLRSNDNTRMWPFPIVDARLTSAHISFALRPECGWEGGVTGPPAPRLRGTYSCPNESGSWEATPGGAPVASVAVRWDVQTVVGGVVQLAAVARDAAGHVLSRPVTWASDNPQVATVADSGLVMTLTSGTARLTAASEGMSGSAGVTANVVAFGSVGGGAFHSCGVTPSGAAYCWGWGGNGQLGTGFRPIGRPPAIAPLASAETPLAVVGGRAFASVSAGGWHSCGVAAGGDTYCWGDNSFGQLGDGSTTSSLLPVPVAGGQFAHVTVGVLHSCGVTAANEVYCWGDNGWGQLGDGSLFPRSSPVRVAANVLFRTVRALAYHTCGVTNANQAYCWGFNYFGQVGNGSTALAVTSPSEVVGGRSFLTVAPAYAHSCAIAPDGAAYCWGAQYQLAPVQVAAGPFATTDRALAAGAEHTCALTPAGAAYCWGRNFLGQLGDGSTVDRSSAVAVAGGFSFATISAGAYHSCGITTGAFALCWGNNANGQLGADAPQSCVVDGNGTTLPCATAPVPVTGQAGAAAARSLWVDAGWQPPRQEPSVRLRSPGPGILPVAPSLRAPKQ